MGTNKELSIFVPKISHMAKQDTRYQKETVVKVDYNGKIPPYSEEMEKNVLGQIMINGDSITDVMNLLKKEVFHLDKHQHIFNAMTELTSAHEPITIVTVIEQLQKDGKLTEAGGPAYISDLSIQVSSSANIEYHAKLLVQKYIQRELIRVAAQITEKAFEPSCDLKDLTDFSEKEILSVTDQNLQNKQIRNISTVADDVFKQILAAKESKNTFTGIPTGFTRLDRITLGWQPGNMIVIAARPGMGKTAFVLTMLRNMAVDYGHPVAMFSLEMSCDQLASRLFVGEARISQNDLRTGRITDTQLDILANAKEKLAQAPIYLDDTAGLNVYEFRSKCRRLVERYNVKCIVVDYLQLMTATSNGFSREQEVSTISRQIKAVAMELKVPIIALSQLNRQVEGRTTTDKRPQLSDLRESGAIEQDADLVLFIHRPVKAMKIENPTPEDERRAYIIIEKNRHGAGGDVELSFEGQYMKFYDIENNAPQLNASTFLSTKTMESKMNTLTEDAPLPMFSQQPFDNIAGTPKGDDNPLGMSNNIDQQDPF